MSEVDRESIIASLEETQQWAANTVMHLDRKNDRLQRQLNEALEELAELRVVRERFDVRGRLLIRCRRIVNTFQNPALAMKSLQDLLDGLDVEEEE